MSTPAPNDDRDVSRENPYQPPGMDAGPVAERDVPVVAPRNRLGAPHWGLIAGAIALVGFLFIGLWFPSFHEHAPPVSHQIAQLSLDLLLAVQSGLGLALLAHGMMRKRFLQLMPGHWLAIRAVTAMAAQIVVQNMTRGPDIEVGFSVFRPEWFTSHAIDDLPQALFFLVVAIGSKESGVWRAFASLRAMVAVLNFAFVPLQLLAAQSVSDSPQVLIGVNTIAIIVLNLTSFVLFVTGLILDWRNQKERDSLHWWGIGLAIGVPLYQALIPLVLSALGRM